MFVKRNKLSAAVSGKSISSSKYNSEMDNIYGILSTLDSNTVYYDNALFEMAATPPVDMYIKFGIDVGSEYYIRYLPTNSPDSEANYRKIVGKSAGERVDISIDSSSIVPVGNANLTISVPNATSNTDIFLSNIFGETYQGVVTENAKTAAFTGVKKGIYVGYVKNASHFGTIKVNVQANTTNEAYLEYPYTSGQNSGFVYGVVSSSQVTDVKVLKAETIQSALEDIVEDVSAGFSEVASDIENMVIRDSSQDASISSLFNWKDEQVADTEALQQEVNTQGASILVLSGESGQHANAISSLEAVTAVQGTAINEIQTAQNAANTYTDNQVSPVKTEVENARAGSANLKERIDNLDTSLQSVTSEVVQARGGHWDTLSMRLDNYDVSLAFVGSRVDNVNVTLQEIQTSLMPIGSVLHFGGINAPSKWLLCDGQAVSRSTYSALFSVLGTRFGAGNGSTTFNLPDLRSSFPIHKDSRDTPYNTLGKTGGAKTHTLTVGEMPSHNHGVNYQNTTTPGNSAGIPGTTTSPTGHTNKLFIGNEGGGQAHNNMPPYLTVYIWKRTG